jgi:ubiquinone/menaquinone biosynthesis C-methylase UbiE
MKLHEYQRNYELEQHYWWFIGVRAMVRSLLSLCPGHGRLGRVLDVGCGTGALLDQLQACSAEVWGLDISYEALQYCALRGHKHLIRADAAHVPFPSAAFDVVTAIGVIEHLEDDQAFLLEIKRLLKPDGSFILLTSSFPCLWSMHDTANEHKRRYYRRQLEQKINRIGFETVRFSYLNCLLFPAIAPALLLHRLIYGLQADHPHRILPLPPPLINSALTWLLRIEAHLMRWTPLPWGISMIGVFKRLRCAD